MGHIIELEDSDILNNEDSSITVIEERYIEGNLLKLTKEQINIELTNLLYESYKNDVLTKVSTFTKLFYNHDRSDIDKSFDIFPIVKFTKIEHYETNDFQVDADFEKENELKYIQLQTFLNQFYILSKSRHSYDAGVKKMGSLFTPFISSGDVEKIIQSTDVYRDYNGEVSAVPWRVLEDDEINVTGYMSKGIYSNGGLITFNWSQYLQELKALKTGDKVDIMYNDFIFGKDGKVQLSSKGKIDRIIKDILYIQHSEGILKYDRRDITTSCYVYLEGSQNVFSRFNLFNNNVIFKNIDIPTIKKYIHPNNFNEILFLLSQTVYQYTDLKNFDDISNIYHPNYITKSSQSILRTLLEKRYTPLHHSRPRQQKYERHFPRLLKELKPNSEGTYADTDIHRFKILHSDFNIENIHILNLLKKYVEKKHVNIDAIVELRNKLEREIESIHLQDDLTCKKPSSITIAKVYSSLDDLKNDNGKKIYFDEGLDPTDYKIKMKYDNEGSIRQELSKKGSSSRDLEFEVKTIMKGKRKVRDGDSCLLSSIKGDSLYTMKTVNGESIWVKQAKLPFKVCVDDLLTTKKIPDNICVYDTYSKICKTLKSVKMNIIYNKLKIKIDILDSVIDYHKNSKKILESIDDDIHFNKSLDELKEKNYNSSINIEKLPSVDLDEYFGDGEVETNLNELTFNETQQYSVLFSDEGKSTSQIEISGISLEFIDMLVGFMDLTIEDHDKKYVVDYVNSQVSSYNLDAKLQKERNKLEKQVVRALYETNMEYRSKIDSMIKKKLEDIQYKVLVDMYYDISKHGIAMLSLIIMSKYPDILLKNIYPSCVRFMTYQGYPINDRNASRSISQYMCCLVKGITSGSDTKFDKIQSESIEKFNEEVLNIKDKILKDNINLRLRVEANKALLQERKVSEDKKAQKEFYGFRPNFDFSSSKLGKIAKILNELNKVVKESKHLKVGITKVPYLFNSCCLERLSGSLTYYDIFNKASDYKQLKKTLKVTKPPKNKMLLPHVVIKKKTNIREGDVSFKHHSPVSNSYIAERYNTILDKMKVYLENNALFHDDHIFKNIEKRYENESYWDEDIFSKTINLYNAIKTFLLNSKSTSQYDSNILEGFGNTLIMLKEVSNPSSVRYTIYNYLRTTFPRILSRVINGKKINKDDDKMTDIFTAFLNNEHYNINIIKEVYNLSLKNIHLIYFESDIIKNITLMNYIYIKVLYNILISTIRSVPSITHDLEESVLFTAHMSSNETTKKNVLLACDLIYHTIESLVQTVSVNDLNINNINKKVEELREEKKQVLIDKYRRNDESRQTQMQLRKFGDKTWEDVDEEGEKDTYVDMLNVDDTDIAKHRNKQEENENYRLYDKGEDADDDDED